jgi:type III pantothenate kinase
VLLIDIGNTRLKWQLRGKVRAQGWDTLPDDAQLGEISQVLAASVGETSIKAVLQQRFGSKLVWFGAPRLDLPIFTHCYKNPERLGVDRWLALLGTRRHCESAALVVDAGTALTVDVLSADNRHEGGFILPGLSMAQRALFQNTAKVRPFDDESAQYSVALGQDTLSCVRQGLLRQALSLVQGLQQDYPQHRLFITGGDGEWLAQALAVPYYSDLIFDGMELCAGYF